LPCAIDLPEWSDEQLPAFELALAIAAVCFRHLRLNALPVK
jgi:hypothetical protein